MFQPTMEKVWSDILVGSESIRFYLHTCVDEKRTWSELTTAGVGEFNGVTSRI